MLVWGFGGDRRTFGPAGMVISPPDCTGTTLLGGVGVGAFGLCESGS